MTTTRRFLIGLTGVALLAVAPPPSGAGPNDPGYAKAFTCSACHGYDGASRSDTVPVLAGMPAWYLKKTIQDYASGKRPAAEITLKELGLDWSQAAFMGDDWPDLPVMRRVAFSCAPANAHGEVKALATHVTQARGGDGAVREFCDLLMVASGRYAALLQEYTA
jgi:hypothetical protein